jgi:glycosyltransferase involved in cell wall biosynthesis
VVQPYRQATQSGVTPLAYHFEKPMIVTSVGGLPEMVPHEKVGLVCAPNSTAITESILRYFEMGESHFLTALKEEKKKYNWSTMTTAIQKLSSTL